MTTYLTDNAYFTNEFDLDQAAKFHVNANWNAMNTTDRAILNVIHEHSMKYGAAQLNHETIEKNVLKSNATVRRTIRKLERLGIIDRIHFIRPVMNGLGANIYAIKPYNNHF